MKREINYQPGCTIKLWFWNIFITEKVVFFCQEYLICVFFMIQVQKKIKDVEISVPIVYGNAAFWLGKKASE